MLLRGLAVPTLVMAEVMAVMAVMAVFMEEAGVEPAAIQDPAAQATLAQQTLLRGQQVEQVLVGVAELAALAEMQGLLAAAVGLGCMGKGRVVTAAVPMHQLITMVITVAEDLEGLMGMEFQVHQRHQLFTLVAVIMVVAVGDLTI